MIILLKREANEKEVNELMNLIRSQYAEPIYIEKERAISVLDNIQKVEISPSTIHSLPCVEKVVCYSAKELMV